MIIIQFKTTPVDNCLEENYHILVHPLFLLTCFALKIKSQDLRHLQNNILSSKNTFKTICDKEQKDTRCMYHHCHHTMGDKPVCSALYCY